MGEIRKPNFSEPQHLSPDHDLSDFDCGRDSLNCWLQQRALKSEGMSSRTYVVLHNGKIVGFYCLSAGAVSREEVAGGLRRNMPDSIPILLLGRMGVDLRVQGQGLGVSLLRDSVLRAANAAKEIGARAILVHAVDETVVRFYIKYGFIESPIKDTTLILPLDRINEFLKG